MPNPLRIACLCILISAVTSSAHAQGRVRAAATPPTAPPPSLALPAGLACGAASAAPLNLTVTYIGAHQIDLSWTVPDTPSGCKFDHYEINCPGPNCGPNLPKDMPFSLTSTTYNDTGLEPETFYNFTVVADYVDVNNSPVKTPAQVPAVYAETTLLGCLLVPVRKACMNFGAGIDTNTNIDTNVNRFWQTSGPYSLLSQAKSIYNGASGSATISADLGTLNFRNGMQVAVTTNAQAGSSGVTAVSAGMLPTLSSNSAGQATQNMLYGGTFLISETYPLLAVGALKLNTPGGIGLSVDFTAKGGIDVQNFASGTNINVVSPPFHGSSQLTTYLQYNSINLLQNSLNFVGSLFAGGSYGYSYTSPAYLRNYGFGGKPNNGIGQVSVGILLNTVARISFSRGFGPSQTYTDSTTMGKTSVNNFKVWSVGVTYQSPTPTPASKQ
jgi:hypothetical protein